MSLSAIIRRSLPTASPTGVDGLRASCPLCDSKRGFVIQPSTGFWICWSCRESGGAVQFLRRCCGLSPDMVDKVLEGLVLRVRTRQQATSSELRMHKWDTLPEYVLGAYAGALPAELLDQGFTRSTIGAAEVGVDVNEGRITFPIRDILGRLCAISGRSRVHNQIPKYKVYDARAPSDGRKPGPLHGVLGQGETYRPDNRRHLYGYHTTYPHRYLAPREEELPPVVLTEGYKSTLWLRQHGHPHAVGLQGSAITLQQSIVLQRVRGPYVIFLDNEPGKAYPDRNGRCAALDIYHALKSSGAVRIATYPEGLPIGTSPDDLDEDLINYIVQTAKTRAQLR